MTPLNRLPGLVVLFALPVQALAADAAAFTLGKAVPSDVYIYAHGVYNPEADFQKEYWLDVWKAFQASGVVEDVHNLINTSLPEHERAGFQKFWTKAGELIRGVDWNARIEEGVYAGRMSAPIPEYLVLLRYEEGKAQRNAEAFAAVLKEIDVAAGPEGSVAFETSMSHGATVSTLSFDSRTPLSIRVAARGAVVAISADRTLMDEALAALAGEPTKTALVQSPRYREAMGRLPAPEDGLMFVDVHAILNGVRGIMDHATRDAANDTDAQEATRIVGKILDEFMLFDYVASTSRTEGYQQLSDSIVSLSPDAERSRLYRVFRPDPVEKFDRFIPKEATGYSVYTGIDLSALYEGVLAFIEKEVAGGRKVLAEWDRAQNQINFRPDRDVFSWLGGQIISVTLPATTPTPFSTSDSVLLVKVRDEAKAAGKIKAGLDRLNNFLTTRGSPLTSQPAGVEGADGFRMVTHPIVMMFLRPVYGVKDGYLLIGTSSKAIEACLATARGERPSVSTNERVQKEAILPTGPVASASFQDLSTLGRDIAQLLNAAAFISALIPDQPEMRPVRGALGIVGKLGPVAEKIDFIRSNSTMSTFDGKAWHSKSVTTYREPKPETAPAQASM